MNDHLRHHYRAYIWYALWLFSIAVCRRRRWRRVLQLHLLLRLCECDYLPHRHLRRIRFLLFLWGRNRVAASNRPDVRRQSSWLLQTYLSSTLLKANPACLYDNIAAVMFVWKVYIDAGVLFSRLNNSITMCLLCFSQDHRLSRAQRFSRYLPSLSDRVVVVWAYVVISTLINLVLLMSCSVCTVCMYVFLGPSSG